MSMANESRQAKTIAELRGFIKKVLADPSIPGKCMEIARNLRSEEDSRRKIADQISGTTTIRIPEEMSEADQMFLEVIEDVLEDEMALY